MYVTIKRGLDYGINRIVMGILFTKYCMVAK
jgi:hypothetical protein